MKPRADDALLGQILERIRIRSHQYFPDLGEGMRLQVRSKVSRAYSQIYRVALTNSGRQEREVIIKIFPDAEAQFRAMKALWPRFAGHSTWGIPKPLDYLEEGPALVTEFVPARSLHDKLPWAELERCLPRAGADGLLSCRAVAAVLSRSGPRFRVPDA